jgi:hypothetical protein
MLAGRVIFSDGAAPGTLMGVKVRQPFPASTLWSPLDAEGRFAITGLHEGPVSVQIGESKWEGLARPGFRLSPRNACLDPGAPWQLSGQLNRDITDLTIPFEKGNIPEPSQDPAALAAFQKASAGPIAGIPAATGSKNDK